MVKLRVFVSEAQSISTVPHTHGGQTDRQTVYAHTVVTGLLECDQNQCYLIFCLPISTHVMGQVLSPPVEAQMVL